MSAALLSYSELQQLREVEPYAYQVAHYILQDEWLAEEAAKMALLALSHAHKPFEGSAEELRCLTRKLTISASIKAASSVSSPQSDIWHTSILKEPES